MEDNSSSNFSSSSVNTNNLKNIAWEASNNNDTTPCCSKRTRTVENSRFKGVVVQQNGNWGAQIYSNHQRIWLGTFKSEKDAAMAYDSAATKIRSADSYFQRNFTNPKLNVQESYFQSRYTMEDVLKMIRDGSYRIKFENFLKTNMIENKINGADLISCNLLFQKELTPSDVGKLNRLVIPKKYAVQYFPCIYKKDDEDNHNGGSVADLEIVFYDKLMKAWNFRFCYWKSSHSFVFTRGWNSFVKEKSLKEKDIIKFYKHEGSNNSNNTVFFIDISSRSGESENGFRVDEERSEIGLEQDLMQKEIKSKIEEDHQRKKLRREIVSESKRGREVVNGEGFRLFGVQIR